MLAKLSLLGLDFLIQFNEFVAVDREYDKCFLRSISGKKAMVKEIAYSVFKIFFKGGTT